MKKTIAAIAAMTFALASQAGDIVKPLDSPQPNHDVFDRYMVAKEVARRENTKLTPSNVEIVQPGVAHAHFKGGTATVRFGYENLYCSLNEALLDCESRINRNPSGFVVTGYEGPQKAAPAKRERTAAN